MRAATGPDGAIRVLIVDDSAVARAVLTRAVDAAAGFVVAGAVASVRAALAHLAQAQVEVILLDLEMPGIDGLTALPDLLAAGRGARVLVVSSSCAEGAGATIQALALGAADTLVKPAAGSLAGRFTEALIERLGRVAAASAVETGTLCASRPTRQDFDIVAIGASTGGIHATGQVLRALPADFDVPILITQHLPASFSPYFAAQVALLAGRPCDVATDRMRIRRGRVVVAPGDAHITCVSLGEGGAAIRLTTEAVSSGCMPSVDPMFTSLAQVYGARALAIVLSGMGRDGFDGAGALAQAGATIIAQDRETSVVWGMPGVVANAGLATAVRPPDQIGQFLARRRKMAA